MTRDIRRVGLLYPTRVPTSVKNWSGTPAGIAAGLAAQGVQVVPIGTAVVHPRSLAFMAAERIGRRDPLISRSQQRMAKRTDVLRHSIRRAGPLDALIALGTDTYALDQIRPPDLPVATYDDATLEQQWRNPDSDISGLGYPDDLVAGWCAAQASSSRAADVCCVSTSWAGASLARDYGVPESTVRVVGMGHQPRGTAAGAARSWDTPRFLLVGLDWRRKNGEAVLRAFSRVRSASPDATLDVVGAHPPIDQPGVRGHGVLRRNDAAAQASLNLLYSTATAFVMPSRFDPSPIAYLEAASAGLPVVATTEGGAGELLGEAAVSVAPDDHDALVAGMLRLTDPTEAERLGRLAATRAADASWDKVASRVLDALVTQPVGPRTDG